MDKKEKRFTKSILYSFSQSSITLYEFRVTLPLCHAAVYISPIFIFILNRTVYLNQKAFFSKPNYLSSPSLPYLILFRTAAKLNPRSLFYMVFVRFSEPNHASEPARSLLSVIFIYIYGAFPLLSQQRGLSPLPSPPHAPSSFIVSYDTAFPLPTPPHHPSALSVSYAASFASRPSAINVIVLSRRGRWRCWLAGCWRRC